MPRRRHQQQAGTGQPGPVLDHAAPGVGHIAFGQRLLQAWREAL
ncbi:MAG: hypothetical protein Q8N45_03205 [Anaerolineales bacterium]|nr:hypothetical protein [Anaerolineales bacterium]MDP3184248.1 hypothetical protein [Anaerolineales bacterium]